MKSRSVPARIGLVLLNLFAPGLGVLRLGRIRTATWLLLTFPAAFLLLFGFYAFAPTLNFVTYVVSGGLFLAIALGALFGSIVITWAGSRFRSGHVSRLSAWYTILLVVVLFTVGANAVAEFGHRYYKPFYLPAEAMAPTLRKGDRILASMRASQPLKRGDVIVFDTPSGAYIKRIAGLPGDRVALVHGKVMINGVLVEQRPLGIERMMTSGEAVQALRLRERFPGEAADHQVYDLGLSVLDDMAEQKVVPGHLFVLGDNRDRSADSRVPLTEMGVEQVSIAAVLGKPLFFTWGMRIAPGKPVGSY